ncbi:MAG: hypothetical protein P8Z67_03835, partial [Gammaproteobacteria bacterium]
CGNTACTGCGRIAESAGQMQRLNLCATVKKVSTLNTQKLKQVFSIILVLTLLGLSLLYLFPDSL